MTMNVAISTTRRHYTDKPTAQTDAEVHIKLTWTIDFYHLKSYDPVVFSSMLAIYRTLHNIGYFLMLALVVTEMMLISGTKHDLLGTTLRSLFFAMLKSFIYWLNFIQIINIELNE